MGWRFFVYSGSASLGRCAMLAHNNPFKDKVAALLGFLYRVPALFHLPVLVSGIPYHIPRFCQTRKSSIPSRLPTPRHRTCRQKVISPGRLLTPRPQLGDKELSRSGHLVSLLRGIGQKGWHLHSDRWASHSYSARLVPSHTLHGILDMYKDANTARGQSLRTPNLPMNLTTNLPTNLDVNKTPDLNMNKTPDLNVNTPLYPDVTRSSTWM